MSIPFNEIRQSFKDQTPNFVVKGPEDLTRLEKICKSCVAMIPPMFPRFSSPELEKPLQSIKQMVEAFRLINDIEQAHKDQQEELFDRSSEEHDHLYQTTE